MSNLNGCITKPMIGSYHAYTRWKATCLLDSGLTNSLCGLLVGVNVVCIHTHLQLFLTRVGVGKGKGKDLAKGVTTVLGKGTTIGIGATIGNYIQSTSLFISQSISLIMRSAFE
jgi:hypothetical protein